MKGTALFLAGCLIYPALFITGAGALWAMSIAARSAYHYWRSK